MNETINKAKTSIKNFGKYLREISAIVIGVAITLSASYLLSIRSEKKDMVLYLNAMKMELEENIKTLEKSTEYFQTSVKYADYLKSNDKNLLHEDTIQKYAKNCYTIYTYTFKTNAFEMFKGSGIMRLVKDKELLLAIWDAYSDLIELKQGFDWHDQIKWGYMKEDFSGIDFNDGAPSLKIVPMYTFYSLGMPYGIFNGCKEALQTVQEAIEKLGKVL
ncbi:MAG: hypothetical protein FWD09_03130 [Lentimicrobiaceae bacterium]|nr:hypothetical protein [Lentimicrobiaceae bacterium]